MEKRHLRLVYGGLSDCYRLSGIRCRLATSRVLSPEPDAVVFEEDTHLILTVDKVIKYVETHPLRLIRDIQNAKVHRPGSLVTKGKNWYAVVIDLDRRPLCSVEWIDEAYGKIGRQIRREGITVIGLHLLGTVHGRIPVSETLALFARAVRDWQPGPLREVWLIVPKRLREEVGRQLRGYVDS